MEEFGSNLEAQLAEKMEKEYEAPKPHCLIVPYPIQGHINPMLQFAKRLEHRGIKITFALTRYLVKNTQEFSWGSTPVDIISDGFDEGLMNNDLEEYRARFRKIGSETLAEVLEKLKNSGDGVDCVITGSNNPWGLDVAKKFGLMGASFITQSCAILSIYHHWYNGQIQLPFQENDEVVVVPGLPVMKPRDMPSFMYDYGSHPGALKMISAQLQNIQTADWLFVNTFYKLEEQVIDLMRKHLQVRAIGPCIPSVYMDKRLHNDKEYGLSIFKPVTDSCMDWLNNRSSKSVIYVSFGSLAQLGEEQMEELAQALELTGKYFLWVVRATEVSKLPKKIVAETYEKGLIVSWCQQLEVLSHDAIGCFVTHCGWNSTLEALSLGVPMVGIPWWSDQSTNAKFVADVWEMGFRAKADVNGIVRKEEIVQCIKNVMEHEGGEVIRKIAAKWRMLAKEAVDVGGNSDQNIEEFVSSLVALASGRK